MEGSWGNLLRFWSEEKKMINTLPGQSNDNEMKFTPTLNNKFEVSLTDQKVSNTVLKTTPFYSFLLSNIFSNLAHSQN